MTFFGYELQQGGAIAIAVFIALALGYFVGKETK